MRIGCAIFVVMLAGLLGYAQQSPQSQPSDQSQAQTNAKQQKNGKSADDTNPFPEAASKKAEDAANPATPDAKTVPPNHSSSHVDLKKFDAPEGSESRISDGAGGFVHDPELAAHDDKIGKFYLQTGDFKGAYDRYKEATEVAPEDSDAVFGLAESARGLRRTQEATACYRIYLDAFPDGKRAKEARKALAALNEQQKK